MAKNGIIHKAALKARRYTGRVVYAIRDALGNMHYLLSLSIRGTLLAMCAASRDGRVLVVRHP